jgi:ABC-type taurine transport system ATPase subunit
MQTGAVVTKYVQKRMTEQVDKIKNGTNFKILLMTEKVCQNLILANLTMVMSPE